jgi:tetratricopeptide (TPR) repeat protein
MNMSIRKLGLALGILAISTTAIGQKKNETSAAVENQRAVASMNSGNIEGYKNALLSAREFIDLAASHEDTKNNQKTLWLQGEIYSSLAAIGVGTSDADVLKAIGGSENAMKVAVKALKKGYPLGKKFKEDIVITIDKNRVLLDGMASKLYGEGDFVNAAEMYAGRAAFGDARDLLDTNAVFNAALCYEKSDQFVTAAKLYITLAEARYRGNDCTVLASGAYRKAGDVASAKAVVAEARKKYPTDKVLLLEVVNTSIAEGDAAAAELALNDAIATDPNNKELHYTIGTIMIDLKKNKEAETALNKALAIDPNYVDAQYQLGAHLVTWAGAIKLEASKLDIDDPNYRTMSQQSEETYGRALIPLEKYIAAFPNDKSVLIILFQIERNLGNSEKALAYKTRADAIPD